MRLPNSEFRRRLPAPAPGEAARRLLALARRMRERRAKSPKNVSLRADEYVYDIER